MAILYICTCYYSVRITDILHSLCVRLTYGILSKPWPCGAVSSKGKENNSV